MITERITILYSTSDILINSVLGISIVFTALSLLAFAFSMSAKVFKSKSKKRSVQAGVSENTHADLDAYTAVAISTALHLYISGKERHIEESNIITIKRIQKRYSPWSSKIYNMNNQQLKR